MTQPSRCIKWRMSPDPTAVELSLRCDDPTPPSPPTKGGEGRGEEGCWHDSETPLPNPPFVPHGEREKIGVAPQEGLIQWRRTLTLSPRGTNGGLGRGVSESCQQ